jgi:hypothetical protein
MSIRMVTPKTQAEEKKYMPVKSVGVSGSNKCPPDEDY